MLRRIALVLLIIVAAVCPSMSEVCAAVESSGSVVARPTQSIRTTFYSQNTVDNVAANPVSQTRIHADLKELAPELSFGAGLWIDQDARSSGGVIHNDNQLSPFLGLAWRRPALSVGATADLAYVVPWQPGEPSHRGSEPVARLSLFHSKFMAKRAAALFVRDATAPGVSASDGGGSKNDEGGPEVFLETYSSAFFTSRLDDNLTLDHWTKSGIRFSVLSLGRARLHADLLGEVRARDNARAWEWDEFGDSRVGLRLGWMQPGLAVSLSVSRLVVPLWGFKTAPLSGLLVIGGEI